MNITALKIVLDTNVLIASIGRRSPFRWIFDAIIHGSLSLCVSNEIILEYQEILEKKTSQSVAENITNFITISPFTETVEIHYRFSLISEDAADNKFVDCAIASNAVCIVSNDRHFQVLKSIEFPKVLVFTVEEFEAQNKSNLIL